MMKNELSLSTLKCNVLIQCVFAIYEINLCLHQFFSVYVL